MRRVGSTCLLLLALGTLGCPAKESAPEPEKVDAADRPPGKDTKKSATKAEDTKVKDPPPKVRDGSMGITYADELATLQRRLEQQVKRTEKVKGYLAWEQAAGTALQIARLTGDYADYKKAEETIAKTFEPSPGHGSFSLRAKFNYQVHRLDAMNDDLAEATKRAAVTGGGKKAGPMVVLKGNQAMQQGKYDEALALWDEADRAAADSAKMSRALWAFHTGDFAKAEEIYASMAKNYHAREGEGAAWLDLIQAIMDLERGRYDDALAHLDDADKDLSGYWLVDEHRAEITALKGDTKTAETMYREIIERTNNPEFMDALASILAETGREDESKQWIDKATKRYEEQLELYPEAAYGHALGHFLDFGPPERALEMAKKNFELRPNVEAQILLAQAQLANEKVAEAKKTIDAALASPWKSADLFHTASEVYAAAGDEGKAQGLLTKAKAINPHVADE